MAMNTGLESQKRDWKNLGESDPFWAVLSDPAKRNNRWDTTDFYRTGEENVAAMMSFISSNLGIQLSGKRALDFGCGPGRLTAALSKRFEECYGVDISPSMLNIARQHVDAKFVEHSDPDLKLFPSDFFDFICSFYVLQHQPSQSIAAKYIEEIVRVLAPGGIAVFQVPSNIPLKNRIQPKRKLYKILNGIGASKLSGKLNLSPISMLGIPEKRVNQIVESKGSVIRLVQRRLVPNGVQDATYYVCK
ncbi:MAG TPA: methyltransferase domain-containing protein [Terriglobales bacterium]|nr:methyltransferase domain-containing protein [Terriglobales bacterium]